MESLERYHGHFYNWYDTESLRPLLPLYVSTVDSGNLAAHLLILSNGLLELLDRPILEARFFDGVHHTLGVLIGSCRDRGYAAVCAASGCRVESARRSPPVTLPRCRVCLERLDAMAGEALKTSKCRPESEVYCVGSCSIAGQCRDALDDLDVACPVSIRTRHRHSHAGQLLSIALPNERIAVIRRLAFEASQFANIEYDFLFDKTSRLFAIGYNASEHRRDASYYDLLASEARLASFVAIAQNAIPQENWFSLGRLLTSTGGDPVLVSWSGSMFEYLMPLLVMPTYENTLLDQTYKAAVKRQIEYGKERGVPWGISECGYNAVDANLNYQYRAFGAPGLGLKRGLTEDLVDCSLRVGTCFDGAA